MGLVLCLFLYLDGYRCGFVQTSQYLDISAVDVASLNEFQDSSGFDGIKGFFVVEFL